MAEGFSFELLKSSHPAGARLGMLRTLRGQIPTPVFMPVGTVGSVKGLAMDQVRSSCEGLILGNTYHLALRPGKERIKRLGGLHRFMGWDGPILTDSGGFQIFSLADRAKITEHGVVFHSHLDGSRLELTPEESIAIQEALGSDIAMVLDHVIALPAGRQEVTEAMERSKRWAARCLDAAQLTRQAKFAIVQGGLEVDLRQASAQALTGMPFDGYAVGGLSVGEAPSEMYRIIQATTPHLPVDKPRYLMGVGRPIDILEGIARGIDMFDCVMPTRNGRNAMAFTWNGTVRMRNAMHAEDQQPLDPNCPCLACRHSKAYLRHLFMANEMLGPILLSHHNLTFYQQLVAAARQQIAQGTYQQWLDEHRKQLSGPAPGNDSETSRNDPESDVK